MNMCINFKTSKLAAALVAVASCLTTSEGIAQSVVFDGSMGPAGSLSGDMVIGNEYGTQVGANLFHSFSIFNVLTGESATFTSNFAGATHNVIARVTGGVGSLVDGPMINQIPGANLWLINPAGVVFGDSASVDVQGSFHVSTADYLLLDDGGRFSAQLDDATGTILTMGNPTTFGFLGPNPNAIAVSGSIHVNDGADISLTAGEINLDRGNLSAPGGNISLTGVMGTGEVQLGAGRPDINGFDSRGDITLEGGSSLDVHGNAGGSVFIHGGQFVMSGGSIIDAGTVDQGGGAVSIDVDNAEIGGNSMINTDTIGDGNAASVSLIAGNSVHLSDGSFISTGTGSGGKGGNITVMAGDQVSLSGWDPVSGDLTGLFSNSTRFGNSGDIRIDATHVSIVDGARISSSASFFGDAGNITINAPGSLYVAGESGNADISAIYSSNRSRGSSGDISITAGDVTFLDGAHIMGEAGTSGGRNGGDSANVNINATGDVLFQGSASTRFASGIYTGTYSGGSAGTISITGNDISIIQGGLVARAVGGGAAGQILISAAGDFTLDSMLDGVAGIAWMSAEMYGEGDGGVIAIEANNVYLLNGSEVILRNSNTAGGAAGQLSITARDSIYQIGSEDKATAVFAEGFERGSNSADISYSARDIVLERALINIDMRDTEGRAGTIFLNASDSILVTDNSGIGSASFNGTQPGADIYIDTSSLEISDNSEVFTNTYFDSAGAGNIYINADELTISNAGIDAGSCFCSSGGAGGIFVNVSGNIYLSGTQGIAGPAGIRSRTLGSGSGGMIDISAGGIFISDGAAIVASSEATAQDFIEVGLPGEVPGSAGSIFVSADYLEMVSGGSIQSAAIEAAGGNISLDIGEYIYLTDASISAEAQGVTPEDDGGNVTITGPTAIVMNHSVIRANANAGNGGNISITTEALVPSIDSVLDASSQTGIDGQVVIDSPNQAVSSAALLDAPVLDVAELVQDPCEVDVSEQRSSLTVEGQGGLPAAPDDYRSAPSPTRDRRNTQAEPSVEPAALAHSPSFGQCEETGP